VEADILKLLNEIRDRMGVIAPKWVSIKDASIMTSCSKSTLRRAVQKGELKASRKTGKLLFRISNIDKWLS